MMAWMGEIGGLIGGSAGLEWEAEIQNLPIN